MVKLAASIKLDKDVKHIKLDKDGNYCGYLGVSKLSGIPKWMVYKGKPY